MTDEQRRKLETHVTFNQSIPRMRDNMGSYFLNDGEIITFTDIESYTSNSEYVINNNPNHKIWFSQLSQIFFDQYDNMQLDLATIKVGGKEIGIYEFDDLSFWEKVKNKKFKVQKKGPYYIVNKSSETMVNQKIFTYDEIQAYILRCINDNHTEKIGDLLKRAPLYNLIEI